MNNKLKIKLNFASGFTFLEVIIAVFIFVIAVVMVAQIFGSGYMGFKKSHLLQQNLETAQQAINILAKTLRTSEIINVTGNKEIKVFDYSRLSNNCIIYKFLDDGAALKVGSVTIDSSSENPLTDCQSSIFSPSQNMTSGKVYGNFFVVQNDPNNQTVGRITISMRVCLRESCEGNPKDEARLQTTVSLRNFEEVSS